MHPLVRRAGTTGDLPEWARCAEDRRGHLDRMAELMEEWAGELGLGEDDRIRWRAAAYLHDALRDADLSELRPWAHRDWPPATLHGPACAARLEAEGVDDAALVRAVRYHTCGHPDFDRLGDHLYLADYLEPGRDFDPEVRDRLRRRVAEDPGRVLLEVIRKRLEHLLEVPRAILPESVAYWNRRLEEGADRVAGGEATG